MRVSPSYELARLESVGLLSGRETLPADFDTVRAVYDDLGDVTLDLEEWVERFAFRAFSHGGKAPSVTSLGVMRYGADPASVSVEDFAASTWVAQGERSTLMAAIPLGMPKARILKQIADLLDQVQPTDRDTSPVVPKYKVESDRRIVTGARKYLRCLSIKATHVDEPLWKIGLRAKLSRTYSGMLDPQNPPPKHKEVDYKSSLKILTSRALLRGHMIAENAARGIFPSYAKCEHALPVDYEFIKERR
ncbi:hypothetical protein ATE69_13400 [Sphingopyxis sp. H071]|nr:hypothetical protein ATE69_13400 [Sphingopyxis sp. H071]